MKQEFLSGMAELLSRVVSLVLVLIFYVIFYLSWSGGGRGSVNLNGLVGQGTLILGSIVLYELTAFVFYELFSLVEARALSLMERRETVAIDAELENKEPIQQQVIE